VRRDLVDMLLAFGAVIAACLAATTLTLWAFGIHP
jgi:hypothetical protein